MSSPGFRRARTKPPKAEGAKRAETPTGIIRQVESDGRLELPSSILPTERNLPWPAIFGLLSLGFLGLAYLIGH